MTKRMGGFAEAVLAFYYRKQLEGSKNPKPIIYTPCIPARGVFFIYKEENPEDFNYERKI